MLWRSKHIFLLNYSRPKIIPFMRCCVKAKQATDDNKAHALCMLDKTLKTCSKNKILVAVPRQ